MLSVLREERQIGELSAAEIDLLIRQARPSRLLSTIARLTDDQDAWTHLPEGACQQLRSAITLADANLRTLKWELNRVQEALDEVDFPVILLKGSAYAMLGLPNARGRLFGDIDLMVPKAALETVETRLNWKGWFSPYNHPYDQRYFREWMHELPPLQHTKRQSVLDVHHTIVAPTSRIRANTALIFDSAQALESMPFFQTLCPEDLILHSATHLFINGEFEHGCRDLYDMHSLLCQYGNDRHFFLSLCERANQTGLGRFVFLALRYCRLVFRTPLPDSLEDQLNDKPGEIRIRLMDALFLRALMPDHASCKPAWATFACNLLFLRSHYLRMPINQLVPHLVHKALRADDEDNKP